MQDPEPLTEADTCREYVTPALKQAGWTKEPHSLAQEYTFTDGRILVYGGKPRRAKGKRADYLLRYRRDFPIAVVEAKAADNPAAQGMEQAKEYAQILGVHFAYATNGKEIVEYCFLDGTEQAITSYPSPDELWNRLRAAQGVTDAAAKTLLTPSYHQGNEGSPRYYQEIAVNRALAAILAGKSRAADAGDRNGQVVHRLPDSLEAVVGPMEPGLGASQTAHPVSCRPHGAGG